LIKKLLKNMNQPAICQLSVVPIRAGASDKEEIVSQILFGELVDVLEISKTKKNWCQVRCNWDGYEGWMDKRQLQFLNAYELENYHKNHAYCLDLTSNLTNSSHFLPITMGATLPSFDGFNVHIGSRHYTFGGQAILRGGVQASPEIILKIARRYLYAPYLWGGRSPFGIDCSGFTQVIFMMTGIKLRRDASQQVEQGHAVDFAEQAQSADLAFFDNEKGNITHVGIVMDNNHIIHAAGQVRIDRLDHYGIFNETLGAYTHKLRLIKRFLPDIQHQALPLIKIIPEEIDSNQISIF
jgi:gamma-D-glutamyl-L-lysine dipeptidyl-peptidase